MKEKCPEHNIALVYTKTRYGPRGQCPIGGCTVVDWAKDDTATPANNETRKTRRMAHAVFDNLWRTKKYKRQKLYKELARHLGLAIKETHIGQFNINQCQKTIEFAHSIEEEK